MVSRSQYGNSQSLSIRLPQFNVGLNILDFRFWSKSKGMSQHRGWGWEVTSGDMGQPWGQRSSQNSITAENMVLCHSTWTWTKADLPQAPWECPAAAMLTTFSDPMCKCSSWNYDVLFCPIETLDELSGWKFNIWSSSNVLDSDLSLWSTVQPWGGRGAGGALWGTLGPTMGVMLRGCRILWCWWVEAARTSRCTLT